MKSFLGLITSSLICLVFLLIILSTNPQSSPVVVLIIPFILLYILFFSIVSGLLRKNIRTLQDKHSRARRSLAAVIAALPVILLALQSIGQLTIRDAVTLLIMAVVLGFYVTRISLLKNRSS